MMNMKKLTGRVSINRVQSSRGPDSIKIEIIDALSNILIADVRMTAEQFGMAVTGLSHQHCEVEVGQLELVGKKAIHKVEKVYGAGSSHHDKDWDVKRDKVFAKHEQDGWHANDDDFGNMHRHGRDEKGDYFRVSFEKHVDPESDEAKLYDEHGNRKV